MGGGGECTGSRGNFRDESDSVPTLAIVPSFGMRRHPGVILVPRPQPRSTYEHSLMNECVMWNGNIICPCGHRVILIRGQLFSVTSLLVLLSALDVAAAYLSNSSYSLPKTPKPHK